MQDWIHNEPLREKGTYLYTWYKMLFKMLFIKDGNLQPYLVEPHNVILDS